MNNEFDSIKYLCSEASLLDGNNLWISASTYNGLYKYDIEKREVYFISAFDNEELYEWRLHSCVVSWQDEIIFIPDRAQNIHIYNKKTNSMEELSIGINERKLVRFVRLIDDVLYFMCEKPNMQMVRISLQSREVKIIPLEIEGIQQGISKDYIFLGREIIFTCTQSNIIVFFSTESDTFSYLIVGDYKNKYGTIAYDGQYFWLSSMYEIIKWNKETQAIESFNEFPDGYGMTVITPSDDIVHITGFTNEFSNTEKPFAFSIYFKNKIYLFPQRTNMVVMVDTNSGKIMESKEFDLVGETEKTLHAKYRNTHTHYFACNHINNRSFLLVSLTTRKYYLINGDINQEIGDIYAKEPFNIEGYFQKTKSDILFENDVFNTFYDFVSSI